MKRYKTYMFRDQDPIIAKTLAFTNGTMAELSRRSDVSASTLYNWRNKKTKSPKFATISAVGGAFGKELVWRNK